MISNFKNEINEINEIGTHKQSGSIVWLTGLSGSGKTTIAFKLHECLKSKGYVSVYLDGDLVRQNISKDLGFSEVDRKENIRRVGEISKYLSNEDVIVICAFISPYRADRDSLRASLPSEKFIEIYLSSPVEDCAQRDVKGLYLKAHSGQLNNFTGVSAPYEPPLNPELILDIGHVNLDSCIQQILNLIYQKDILKLSEEG